MSHKPYTLGRQPLAQVCADAADEPLAVAGVRVADGAAAELRACWHAAAADAAAGLEPLALYPDANSFVELVEQVGLE